MSASQDDRYCFTGFVLVPFMIKADPFAFWLQIMTYRNWIMSILAEDKAGLLAIRRLRSVDLLRPEIYSQD